MCLSSSFHLNRIIFTEIAVRAILCLLFFICSSMDPFVRYIQPEEMWKYNYPQTDSYFSTMNLWLLICIVPFFLFLCECLNNKKKRELSQMLLTYTLILGLNGFVTSLFKIIVGRPRPDFLSRCFNGAKYGNIFNCAGERRLVMDGRKSFPSGHSSFAFASMVFVTLYLTRKLKLFHVETQREGWRVCLCLIPLLIAATIAVSRTCDYHHHWEDVLVGSLLGSSIAYISFQYYFAHSSYQYINGNNADGLLLEA